MSPKPCNEEGCTAPPEQVFACFLSPPNEGDEPEADYCVEHAINNGFCGGCGLFCAGLDSFDFGRDGGRYRGFCPTCQDEMETDDQVDEIDENDDMPDEWYAELAEEMKDD